MFNFRQKIFLTYLTLFLVFLLLLFPFASQTVKRIAVKAMEDRATEIIGRIQNAKDNQELVLKLKEQKPLLFFRVSVITNEKKVLYDTHTKKVLGDQFNPETVVDHPEVNEAFRKGVGYHIDFSELLSQKFAYTAKAFDFHGKTYVIRTAFPYEYVAEMSRDFEIGFLGFSGLVLLLFSLMTWFVINHLTRPIQQIIDAVRPFQQGAQQTIPEIKLSSVKSSDDFGKLANTLNSLSEKVQKQIDSLTHERNEKESLLEALTEGVIAVDRSMNIGYVNSSALNLLKQPREALIDQNLAVIKQKKVYDMLFDCQKQNTILNDTLELRQTGGKQFLDLIAIPKKKGSGAILVIQDNSTHHKLLEMRKDFIANASHELKTPITIIQGFAEMLHDNDDLPKPQVETITSKIVSNCSRMTTLIKDLLTLSDIEHIPEYRKTECDLYQLIETCIKTVKELDKVASIELIGDKDLGTFLCDTNLMEMAITNLISNACKYSEPPAEVKVFLEKKDNIILIRIQDKGIGISSEQIPHIFERFKRLDNSLSKKVQGSGLGLSIVAIIIEKHFGKIHVESELGKGTIFTIELPC